MNLVDTHNHYLQALWRRVSPSLSLTFESQPASFTRYLTILEKPNLEKIRKQIIPTADTPRQYSQYMLVLKPKTLHKALVSHIVSCQV